MSTIYTLKNKAGVEAEISNFGARLVALRVPDRNGVFADVTLGYEDLHGVYSRKYFLGATVGRCANRIAGGRFALGDKQYQLPCNENNMTHLHGGNHGFDQQTWTAYMQNTSLRLTYTSPDGEEGYPATLTASVTFTLTDENELVISYDAVADADTLCNLTNHAYFNLAGHNAGDILSHHLRIHADRFTESDAHSIPTGRSLSVADTPMDFREFHLVGERIDSDFQPLVYGHGYDHNYILTTSDTSAPRVCAELYHEESGRYMTCLTTSPCVQLYTGNFIDGTQVGKGGFLYQRHAGLCLETQFAPDAINQPESRSPILRVGERFVHTTIYKFTVK